MEPSAVGPQSCNHMLDHKPPQLSSNSDNESNSHLLLLLAVFP